MTDISESFKGYVHLGACCGCAVLFAWNLGQLCSQPRAGLVVNCGVYFFGWLFESQRIRDHWREM